MALKNKTHEIEPATKQRPPQQIALNSPEHERSMNPVAAFQRATASPSSSLRPADILALQRTIGNRAVQRMLDGPTRKAHASAPSAGTMIQAKLMIGSVDDQYEQEADRVARQVMGMDAQPAGSSLQHTSENEEDLPRGPSPISITPLLQRETSAHDEAVPESSSQSQVTAAPTTAVLNTEQAIRSARGSGELLPPGLRTRMEPAFGADFSGVQVHTGAEADSLNRALHSRAFTTGPDLFFKRGEYDPVSQAGQQLIAHELTHVMQQQARSVNTLQRANGDEQDVKSAPKTVNWGELSKDEKGKLIETMKLYEDKINKTQKYPDQHPLLQDFTNYLVVSKVFEFLPNKKVAITLDNVEALSDACKLTFKKYGSDSLKAIGVQLDGEDYYTTDDLADWILIKLQITDKEMLPSAKQCITNIQDNDVKDGPSPFKAHVSHGKKGGPTVSVFLDKTKKNIVAIGQHKDAVNYKIVWSSTGESGKIGFSKKGQKKDKKDET